MKATTSRTARPLATGRGLRVSSATRELLAIGKPDRAALRRLADPNGALAAEHIHEKVAAALHEAAHLAATVSCQGSSVGCVEVAPSGRHVGYGRVQSMEVCPDEEVFARVAGVAWEERFGDLLRAKDDLYHSLFSICLYPYTWSAAQRFVVSHEDVIHRAAAAIFRLSTQRGVLSGRSLANVVTWLRPQVSPFVRPDGADEYAERVRGTVTWENVCDRVKSITGL